MSEDSGSRPSAQSLKAKPSGLAKRLAPVLVLLLGIAAFFGFGLQDYVTFEALRLHRETLLGFVAENPWLAPLAFMAIYAAAVAFSLPGGAVLSIAGGFLFGAVFGTLLIVVAATVGATALFLIAKTALGDALRSRAGPWVAKMADGFRENALSYLLVLRLVPLFPFFVVNLVPAFLGVGTGVYILGTLVGIIPGAFVFATVGSGLGSLFESGQDFTAAGILTPEIITALVGLAVLALIPVAYKKIKARRG